MVKCKIQNPVVLSLFIFVLFSNDFTNAQSHGGLIHFPPDCGIEGNALEIEVELASHILQPERVLLYFREKGATQYEFVEMYKETNSYHGAIPAAKVIAPEIEYFII